MQEFRIMDKSNVSGIVVYDYEHSVCSCIPCWKYNKVAA